MNTIILICSCSLLQIKCFYCKIPICKLNSPGGPIKPGESEEDGLKRHLHHQLALDTSIEWDIGELAAVFYKPHLDSKELYPYLPAHITKPKEALKLFMVHLPEQQLLSIPKNLKLVAVPFYELHENASKYGVYSALTHVLSRFNVLYL